MNEAETRAEHIDPALKGAGWGVVEGSKILREYPITPGRIEGHGRRGKPLIADYVLVHRNRKLAVHEAKAWDKPLTEGVGQAKDYAGEMAVRFAYATNGQGIYGVDMQTGREGEVPRYPTPDGFLTPFKVKQISTTLDEYVYTPDDKLVEGEIESGKRYEEKDFNKIIEIKEREAHRVKILMEQINQSQKALVFCATQDHALAVRDLINQMKTSTDPNYCQRVTANDGELGEQHLRDFQDNEKTIPTILTTSQKLSTGVDARNIRNIVLMRPIWAGFTNASAESGRPTQTRMSHYPPRRPRGLRGPDTVRSRVSTFRSSTTTPRSTVFLRPNPTCRATSTCRHRPYTRWS